MTKTYDKNNNPVYLKEGVKLTDKWRKETHLEFFNTYGNGWAVFAGLPSRIKKGWIERYKKEGGLE